MRQVDKDNNEINAIDTSLKHNSYLLQRKASALAGENHVLRQALEDIMYELRVMRCDNSCNADHPCRGCSAREIIIKVLK